MLITPKDIRDYTTFNDVRRRTDYQLEFDIIMSEQEIFKYVGHDFSDITKYPTIPDEVRVACIKLSEYNAMMNSDESFVKGYTSVNLAGELQYSLPDGGKIDQTYLQYLLHNHVNEATSSVSGDSKVTFRMRFL